MRNYQIEVLQNHNPHMIRIKPEDQQIDLFANCVIFADAVLYMNDLALIVFDVPQNGIHLIGPSIHIRVDLKNLILRRQGFQLIEKIAPSRGVARVLFSSACKT